MATIAALGAQTHLADARVALENGRAAILRADPAEAEEQFVLAQTALVRAQERLSTPMISLLGITPVVGRTVDTTRVITEAGLAVARAGVLIASSASALEGGIAALAPRMGAIAIHPLRRLEAPFESAAALIDTANASLQSAPDSLLLGRVDEAFEEFEDELADAARAVRSAAVLMRDLPAFLGGDGNRRYFFAAQNPAELRGTGGLIGAYAILSAASGRLKLSPFSPIEELDNLAASSVHAPNPSFARRYDRFGGAGYWPNINLTPDFPSAAVAIEQLYARVTGEQLDGAILADPHALAAMLGATGPIRVPGTSTAVDTDNVVGFVSNEAYSSLDPVGRKRLLGDVARAILRTFLVGAGQDIGAATAAVVGTAAAGHLMIHSQDPDVQETFETLGIAGALRDSGSDFLAVIGNSASGNKVDFYVDRRVRHQVHLLPGGAGNAQTLVALDNHAPDSGQPAYVIGPYPPVSAAGENLTYLSVYCDQSARLSGFEQGGAASHPSSEVELGFPVYSTTLRVPSGESGSARFDWTIGDAWSGSEDRGTYRIVYRDQPTIRVTRLHLEVRSPPGTYITDASPGMQISGDRAVWDGSASTQREFEIEFEAPLHTRIWNEIIRFLGRPLFGCSFCA